MSPARSPVEHIQQTWARFVRQRNDDDRRNLFHHYAPLASALAARVARRLSRRVDADEVRCAAFTGLMGAVESFDPCRATSFETYCRRRITGAVLDWVRSVDMHSRALRSFEKLRARAVQSLTSQDGHVPNDQTVAAHLRFSAARFSRLTRRASAGNPIAFSTLEHRHARSFGDGAPAWDTCDKSAADPTYPTARRLLIEVLTRGFSGEERAVLTLYYYEGLTMAEIGAVLHLSESRISQMHHDILRRLRTRLGPRLRDELAC